MNIAGSFVPAMLLLACTALASAAGEPAGSPAPPATPVKLVFIHHSTGGNWLADVGEHDQAGGLGRALMDSNYFVSATNYGWGPGGIGSRTDIPDWPDWFNDQVMGRVYRESGQNVCGRGQHGDACFGRWPRLSTDPGGENRIILFKSCFPNSDLYGSPDDPPLSEPDDSFTVANAKAVYNRILGYFASRPDKLFVVVTAPPMAEGEYAVNDPDTPGAARAANARALNDWLLSQWLADYPNDNVAVLDYYNVLTSNGSPARVDDRSTTDEPDDYARRPDGNHHYWSGTRVAHTRSVRNDFSAYPSYSGGPDWYDSHPTSSGQRKATRELVPLLNVFYNRWQSGSPRAAGNAVAAAGPADAGSGDRHSAARPAPRPSPGSASTVEHREPAQEPDAAPGPASRPGGTAGPRRQGDIPTTRGRTKPADGLVMPDDLSYLGAFRLPGGDTPPRTFAYGGNAMTFNPDGDPMNSDPHAGSLFITGHDRQPWGELPDGAQLAEVSIPVPAIEDDPADLPQATFLQGFQDVTAGHFTDLEEIPKLGIQYLEHPDTGPLIHLCWGQHLQPPDRPSHAWLGTDLADTRLQGVWFIGRENPYSTNGYLFDLPAAWAEAHAAGRYLATGRMRDGGQGGMGPTLFAYRPWLADGRPPPSGTRLPATVLLKYASTLETEAPARCLRGYQHPDEWEGAAWIGSPSGRQAVVFAGTKGTGTRYWYGYVHPDGPEKPCVDAAVTDFVTCRLADGTACPRSDFGGCCDEAAGTCVSYRGWWSTRFDAQLILYDPAELARVAAGEMEPWEPQPYAAVDIDERLYLDPPEWDLINLGRGDQRRYRIGAAAGDRENGFLYVLELYADGARPVVHVWRVE